MVQKVSLIGGIHSAVFGIIVNVKALKVNPASSVETRTWGLNGSERRNKESGLESCQGILKKWKNMYFFQHKFPWIVLNGFTFDCFFLWSALNAPFQV